MRIYLLFVLLLLPPLSGILAQGPGDASRFVLLLDSGRKRNDKPVMEHLQANSPKIQEVQKLLDSTFMGHAVSFFHRAQYYQLNSGLISRTEPAYLALTPNQGGFARIGFFLEGDTTDHLQTPYVDVLDQKTGFDPARLSSITQLYTHELGHVIYRMLSRGEDQGELIRGSSIHYFPIVTDYNTAFNEGFAEHLENIARQFEPDSRIRQGIRSDLDRIGKKTPRFVAGFEKDLLLPGRLGYYRASMSVWYQQFERYRRSEEARSGVIRYASVSLDGGNAEDRITFRNSALRLDTNQLRTADQMMATEGFISAFFTRLSTSDLGERPLPDSMARRFLLPGEPPEAIATLPAWYRQLLKYWIVFDRHMEFMATEPAQFVQFMEGYAMCFPEERQRLHAIFREVAGFDYPGKAAPEVWVMVKKHTHRILLIDASDAITIPFYTFNLNTAGMEDLLTIRGLSPEGAGAILDYRGRTGGFETLDALRGVPGLAEKDLQQILACAFDQEYYDSVAEPGLNVKALIAAPVFMLLRHGLAWFLILAGTAWIVFLRREPSTPGRRLLWGIRMLALWLLMVIAGLAAVVIFPQPLLPGIALPVAIALLDTWRLRNRPARRNAALTCYLGAVCVLLYALWAM